MDSRVFLIRHGETAWSKSGRHTGTTDVDLTPAGEADAGRLAPLLAGVVFARVLTSPRRRAVRTCELAGLGSRASVSADLAEWDYGDYEGLLSSEIAARRPGWRIFRDGCPGGESPLQVGARADRVIASLRETPGNAALFTHGHFGRALAARWAGLPVEAGEGFLLDPASLSALGYEHGDPRSPVIALWNERP